jgi:hypothetical protein
MRRFTLIEPDKVGCGEWNVLPRLIQVHRVLPLVPVELNCLRGRGDLVRVDSSPEHSWK